MKLYNEKPSQDPKWRRYITETGLLTAANELGFVQERVKSPRSLIRAKPYEVRALAKAEAILRDWYKRLEKSRWRAR